MLSLLTSFAKDDKDDKDDIEISKNDQFRVIGKNISGKVDNYSKFIFTVCLDESSEKLYKCEEILFTINNYKFIGTVIMYK